MPERANVSITSRLPLTVTLTQHDAEPSELVAETVYVPLSLGCDPNISNMHKCPLFTIVYLSPEYNSTVSFLVHIISGSGFAIRVHVIFTLFGASTVTSLGKILNSGATSKVVFVSRLNIFARLSDGESE